MCDIYEFIDGYLKYYRIDEHSNLHDTQIRGSPGTYIEGWTHSFPDLNQLKRVHVSNPRVTQYKVINFMLPHKDALKLNNLQYAGAIIGSYIHDLAPGLSDEKLMNKSTYRTISREWRASFSTLHTKTKAFIEESKIDTSEEVGLSILMRTIRNLFVPPQMKVMIHKLINKALYMGEVANKYQRLIKQVPVDSNILTNN